MERISRGILGYGVGFIGQASIYNCVTTYFVVYMTNCVGIKSSLAGTIMAVALFIEVIAGMAVGNYSDQCTSKLGKRRPFILAATIAMPIIMVLMFTTIKASAGLTFCYYLIISILFRMTFSTFEIPNNAFGAEIARGYDERTILRTTSRVFSIIGSFIAFVAPLWIQGMFHNDLAKSWQITGIALSAVCFASWMTCFTMTKGYSAPAEERKSSGKHGMASGIVKDYIELCKLRSMRLLIIYKAAFSCGYSLYNFAMIYYLKYNVGIENKVISYLFYVTIAVFIIATPFANKSALKVGKSRQQFAMLALSGGAALIIFFAGKNTVAGAAAYVIVFSLMQTTFWQLSPSIFYDIVEVDEFVYGKRRAGDIVSLVSVLGTLISAIIVQLFGILLENSGFDSTLVQQPGSAQMFLTVSYILIPGICLIIGAISLKKFPINKVTFDILTDAVRKKREGHDYSEYNEVISKMI